MKRSTHGLKCGSGCVSPRTAVSLRIRVWIPRVHIEKTKRRHGSPQEMKCNGDIPWVTFPTLFLRSCVFWSSKNAVFLNLAQFWFCFTPTSPQQCPPDIFLWLSERRRQCLRLKSAPLRLLGICHRRCGPWDPKVGTRFPAALEGPLHLVAHALPGLLIAAVERLWSSSQGPDSFSWPLWAPGTHVKHRHTYRSIHIK